MVDVSNPKHTEAYEKLKNKLLGKHTLEVLQSPVGYLPINLGGKAKPQQYKKVSNGSAKQQKDNIKPENPKSRHEKTPAGDQINVGRSGSSGKGKKLKFINFYAQDNKPGLKKGRHPCQCEAQLHDLINNCTKCGRIVCEQEGSGPCFFCDSMVSNCA